MTKPSPVTIAPFSCTIHPRSTFSVNFLFNLISIRSLNLNISLATSPLLSKTKQSIDGTSFSSNNENL